VVPYGHQSLGIDTKVFIIDFGLCHSMKHMSDDKDWKQFSKKGEEPKSGHYYFLAEAILGGRSNITI